MRAAYERESFISCEKRIAVLYCVYICVKDGRGGGDGAARMKSVGSREHLDAVKEGGENEGESARGT